MSIKRPLLNPVHAYVLSITLFLLSGKLQAQIPNIPGLNDQNDETGPAVSFVAGNECGLLEHYQQRIDTYQTALQADENDIANIVNQRDTYQKRLDSIEQYKEDYKKVLEAPPAGNVPRSDSQNEANPTVTADSPQTPPPTSVAPLPMSQSESAAPVNRAAVDRLRELLLLVLKKGDTIDTLHSALKHALTKADTTVASLIVMCRDDEKNSPSTDNQDPVSLSDAISISHRLHLARLALAISRSGSTYRNTSEQVDLSPPPPVINDTEHDPAMAPQPADTALKNGMGQTEKSFQIIEESRQLALTAESYNSVLKELMQQDVAINKLISVVDVQAKKMRVENLSSKLSQSAARVSVTANAVSQQKKQFEKTSKKLKKLIARSEKKLASDRYRISLPNDNRVDSFTKERLLETQQNMLRERLSYLKTKLAYAAFLRDTAVMLRKVAQDQSPQESYFDEHAAFLQAPLRDEQINNLTRRLKAWRRQRIQLSEETPSSENEKNRERILQMLSETTEYCSKQENTLAAGERLAEIVDARLARRNTESQGIPWFLSKAAASLVFIGIAIFLSVVISRVMLRLSSLADNHIKLKVSQANKRANPLYERIQRSTRYGFFTLYVVSILSLWLGATYLAVQVVWGIDPGLSHLQRFLYESLFVIGETQITMLDIIKLISILALTIIVSRLVQLFLRKQVFLFFDWDEGVRNAVSVVLQYALLIIGFSIGLQYLGLGIETFAVFIGIIGLAIGFGLQKLAGSFASGFVVLFGRPVKKGDFVTTGDLEGQILDVSMRTTTVKTRDNVSVIIPNDELVSQKVINWSHDDPLVRLRVPVGVAYGSDIDKVESNLLAAADNHDKLKKHPPPIVLFREFGDSALIFELLVWTTDIRDRFIIVSELNKQIDRRFRDADITIPFPQRDLHLRSAEAKVQTVQPVTSTPEQ